MISESDFFSVQHTYFNLSSMAGVIGNCILVVPHRISGFLIEQNVVVVLRGVSVALAN